MLLGTHTPKLDDKGRVILPAKFRDDLGAGVVITRGQDRCLYVFSEAEFERVHERIREAPLSNKQARDFLRMFLSGASAEKPDGQNRNTVPPHLRTYAGLAALAMVDWVSPHQQAARYTTPSASISVIPRMPKGDERSRRCGCG